MAVNVPYCTIRLHRMARDRVARGWEGGTSSRFLTSTRCVLDEAGEAVAVGPVAPVLVKKLRHEKKQKNRHAGRHADKVVRLFVVELWGQDGQGQGDRRLGRNRIFTWYGISRPQRIHTESIGQQVE